MTQSPVPDEPNHVAMPVRDDVIERAVETVRINKRVVETGRVTVKTHVEERDEAVSAMLERRDVKVERVSIDRVVTDLPVPRQEGDTWVIPVLEERLVVEKQLVLKEEVRITTKITQEQVVSNVNLREEIVSIENSVPGAAADGAPALPSGENS